MKGSEIKRAIADNGRTITEVAAAIGKSQQTLSAALASDDVKSSLIEAIADYLDLPIYSLYGEGNTASVNGNGNAVAGVGNSINDGILIDEIAAQRRLTEQVLTQNGQLLNIIENLTKK